MNSAVKRQKLFEDELWEICELVGLKKAFFPELSNSHESDSHPKEEEVLPQSNETSQDILILDGRLPDSGLLNTGDIMRSNFVIAASRNEEMPILEEIKSLSKPQSDSNLLIPANIQTYIIQNEKLLQKKSANFQQYFQQKITARKNQSNSETSHVIESFVEALETDYSIITLHQIHQKIFESLGNKGKKG
jgi:hypothetical protein